MTTQHVTERYVPGRTALLTIGELAALLGIHRVTVYRLPVPYVLVGERRRYRLEDVEAYLEARREEPAP